MADDLVSDEDKALFRKYVQALKQFKHRSEDVSKELDKKNEYYLSDAITNTVFPDTILSYCHPSLSSKQFKSIKKGQIPWEARLDLHGLTREQARDALSQFIQSKNNERCLLIIHGKGNRIVGSPPIIKNLINRWLPQFNEVIGFHSALPKDGGSGAVYVLLRRMR